MPDATGRKPAAREVLGALKLFSDLLLPRPKASEDQGERPQVLVVSCPTARSPAPAARPRSQRAKAHFLRAKAWPSEKKHPVQTSRRTVPRNRRPNEVRSITVLSIKVPIPRPYAAFRSIRSIDSPFEAITPFRSARSFRSRPELREALPPSRRLRRIPMASLEVFASKGAAEKRYAFEELFARGPHCTAGLCGLCSRALLSRRFLNDPEKALQVLRGRERQLLGGH